MPLLHLDHGNKNNSKKSNWILWLSYNYFFTNEINWVDKYLDKYWELLNLCIIFRCRQTEEIPRCQIYVLFRQITTFIKFCVAFVFGLQTLYISRVWVFASASIRYWDFYEILKYFRTWWLIVYWSNRVKYIPTSLSENFLLKKPQ